LEQKKGGTTYEEKYNEKCHLKDPNTRGSREGTEGEEIAQFHRAFTKIMGLEHTQKNKKLSWKRLSEH